MDAAIKKYIVELQSPDNDIRNEAFTAILSAASEAPVAWAYDVWDTLKRLLADKDNHLRTIAAQIMSELARSDSDRRIMHDFPELMAVTHDERFVTARHSLQSLWRIGLAGPEQRQMVVQGLADRYMNCIEEKNCTLIRFDIVESLGKLYEQVPEEPIKQAVLALIEKEADDKYRNKYAASWRKSAAAAETAAAAKLI